MDREQVEKLPKIIQSLIKKRVGFTKIISYRNSHHIFDLLIGKTTVKMEIANTGSIDLEQKSITYYVNEIIYKYVIESGEDFDFNILIITQFKVPIKNI